MGLTKRIAGNILPKEPMDVINKNNRLRKTLENLHKDGITNNMITILLYSNKKERVVETCSLTSNALSGARKRYYEELPVLKIEKIYENRTRRAANAKNVNYSVLDRVEITIKFLPEAYVNSDLYQLGYINHTIYDFIASKESTESGECVLGSESYELILQHMIKTSGKSDIHSMEKLFKKFCGCDVRIRPSDFCRNKSPEYYIIEKILKKSLKEI